MADQYLSDEEVSKPTQQYLSDAEVSAPAQPRTAYPQDEASTALFQQSTANHIASAAQGNWFTRPFAAASEAAEDSYTGGLAESSVKALTDAGKLADYKNTQAEWQHTVNGALIMPSAAIAAGGLKIADLGLQTLDSIAMGVTGLGLGVTREVTHALDPQGSQGQGGNTTGEARDLVNNLYLLAGIPEMAGVPKATPSLKEYLSLPARAEKAEPVIAGGAAPAAEAEKVVEDAGPVLKAPTNNPLIDQPSGNLNMKYINGKDDVLDLQARVAQAVADRDGVVISNDVAEKEGREMVERAAQEQADGIPPELANRDRGDPVNPTLIYASRFLNEQAGTEVSKLIEIANKTGDARDYAALEEGFDRFMTTQGIRHDVAETWGRGGPAFQIPVGSGEAAQAVAGLTKEDVMRAAMTLPNKQGVSKLLQVAKKGGDAGLSLGGMLTYNYISFLLSNLVTHTAYFASGVVQTAVRVGPENLLSVGAGAAKRALGYGLDADAWGALQKEREGIESRLAASDAAAKGSAAKLKAGESGQMGIRLKEIIAQQKAGETHMPDEIAGRFFGAGHGTVDGLRASGRALVTQSTQMFPREEAAAKAAQSEAESAALKEGKTADEATKAGRDAYDSAAPKMSNPIVEYARSIKNPIFKTAVGAPLAAYGKIVGLSPAMAGAIHTFQKFSGNTESVYAQVYRRAALMGAASDEEMGARIAKMLNNVPEDIAKQAEEDGKYASLINKPGAFGQNMEKWAHTNNWTRFVVPFARIATNLTSQTLLERSPVGLFSSEIRARLAGARGGIAQEDAMARMAFGTSLVTAGAHLAAQGFVHGLGPSKPADRAENHLTGNPELSVQIGTHNIPLRLLGLPGRILSYGAAAHDVLQDWKGGDDLWDALGHSIITVADTALQENALKGLSDLMDAVVGHDAELSKRYALNAVTTAIVPRGIAQVTRLEDPYMRSTMGNGFMERLQKTVDAQLPWKSQSLLPQVDAYGRDMLRNYNPVEAMKDPVTQAEIAAHQLPTKVEPRIDGVKLTDQQYYDYQKKVGTLYYDRMQRLVNTSWFATRSIDVRADTIRTAMDDARAAARQDMLIKNRDLAKAAADYARSLISKKLGHQ